MKNLELPEPANKLWRKTRDTIGDLGLGERAVKTRLGGGTILAARWKHRISTDWGIHVSGVPHVVVRRGWAVNDTRRSRLAHEHRRGCWRGSPAPMRSW